MSANMLMLRHLEMTESKWLSCVESYKPDYEQWSGIKLNYRLISMKFVNSMIVRGGNDSAASASFTFYTDTL